MTARTPPEDTPKVVTPPALPAPQFSDVLYLKLAREIAMDLRPLENVLETHALTAGEFTKITEIPRFQGYLWQAVEEWTSAINAQERVKLKSMSMVEESLPEFYARLHDPKESLMHKTELLKTISRFAGLGGPVDAAGVGEKFVVTINMGADQKFRIERDVTPPGNQIEGETL